MRKNYISILTNISNSEYFKHFSYTIKNKLLRGLFINPQQKWTTERYLSKVNPKS